MPMSCHVLHPVQDCCWFACRLQQLLTATQQGLDKRGASGEVQGFVQQVLQEQHQQYVSFMSSEADKRRKLLEHIRNLEVCGGRCAPALVLQALLKLTVASLPASVEMCKYYKPHRPM